MKSNKLILAILVLSIALNLTIVGFVLGQRLGHSGFAGAGDPLRIYPRWARSLPEQRREALLPMLKQQRQDARAQMRKIQGAHVAVQKAVADPNFDEQVLAASLAQLRSSLATSQETSHEGFVRFVKALSISERQELAQQLRRPKRARHHADKPKHPPWHKERQKEDRGATQQHPR